MVSRGRALQHLTSTGAYRTKTRESRRNGHQKVDIRLGTIKTVALKTYKPESNDFPEFPVSDSVTVETGKAWC